MTTTILPWLWASSLRRRLLAYYFSNPEQRLYLRELARQIGADPGNLSKELKRLEKEGVFLSERRGNQRHYFLNQDYHLYHELKSIVGKTIGVRGTLADFFRGLAMYIILISHMPYNKWSNWIPGRFGFSDATEIFVFCSGMASAIAFGATFRRAG